MNSLLVVLSALVACSAASMVRTAVPHYATIISESGLPVRSGLAPQGLWGLIARSGAIKKSPIHMPAAEGGLRFVPAHYAVAAESAFPAGSALTAKSVPTFFSESAFPSVSAFAPKSLSLVPAHYEIESESALPARSMLAAKALPAIFSESAFPATSAFAPKAFRVVPAHYAVRPESAFTTGHAFAGKALPSFFSESAIPASSLRAVPAEFSEFSEIESAFPSMATLSAKKLSSFGPYSGIVSERAFPATSTFDAESVIVPESAWAPSSGLVAKAVPSHLLAGEFEDVPATTVFESAAPAFSTEYGKSGRIFTSF